MERIIQVCFFCMCLCQRGGGAFKLLGVKDEGGGVRMPIIEKVRNKLIISVIGKGKDD